MSGIAEPISPGQFLWVAGISVVAGGIYLWPQYVISLMGSNGVYALMTTTLLAVGLAMAEVAVALNVQRPTYLTTLKTILPVIGPYVLFPLTAILCLAIDAIVLVLYGLMMQSYFYPFTPRLVIDLVILLVAAWVAVRTLSAVARSVQFWFPIILVLFVFVTVLTVPHIAYLAALKPATHFYVVPWVHSVFATWFLYADGSGIITLTPHVAWKRPRDAYLTAALAILGQGAVLLVLYIVSVGTLGPDALSHLYWPLAYIYSLVSLRSFFFQGVGAFVIIVWTSAITLYLAVHIFCFGWNLSSAVGNSLRASQVRVMAVGGTVAALTLATFLLPSIVVARAVLFHWVTPVSLMWSLMLQPGLWWRSRRWRQGRSAP
ncbi:MAG: GerAB/ArcD/ProY family transporter [Firmicutes bacterium]|nr:GerAB/ArcD/ProY family transporter [Bacillota bacterium]